jgi:hypothetical protein
MSPPDHKPPNRGAVAGTLLVATLLLGVAVGGGLGALVGAPVLLGLIGLFAGALAGFFVVHARFRDL